jgi:hypothetical protein
MIETNGNEILNENIKYSLIDNFIIVNQNTYK